jgi:hypothetical protein
MRFDQPSRLVIDARTDKEGKLKAFIASALASNETAGQITLVARATDSPVATALAAAIAASGRTDLTLSVILFDIDAAVEDHAATSILDVQGAEFRMLHDARFVAVHEQLVLSANRVWIGDCMRRDPNKRDAFELYQINDATSAADAAQSFKRLWNRARPLERSVSRTLTTAVIAAGQTPPADGIATPRR